MMGYWNGDLGLWMVLGMASMLLFWAGVIGLVAWGIVRLTKHSAEDNSGLAVVRERYARGEISKEDLDRIKRDLS
jgi:uncharacterized membrane protein